MYCTHSINQQISTSKRKIKALTFLSKFLLLLLLLLQWNDVFWLNDDRTSASTVTVLLWLIYKISRDKHTILNDLWSEMTFVCCLWFLFVVLCTFFFVWQFQSIGCCGWCCFRQCACWFAATEYCCCRCYRSAIFIWFLFYVNIYAMLRKSHTIKLTVGCATHGWYRLLSMSLLH